MLTGGALTTAKPEQDSICVSCVFKCSTCDTSADYSRKLVSCRSRHSPGLLVCYDSCGRDSMRRKDKSHPNSSGSRSTKNSRCDLPQREYSESSLEVIARSERRSASLELCSALIDCHSVIGSLTLVGLRRRWSRHQSPTC